ncbi:sigma 54-interacting transcriptional regulator, partial [bacterium]|nr:sigma 54-interacting transcriptional regulator [bacterium]
LRFLAGTVQPVLIEGETGVGKSLCARLLHQLSKRQSASFVRYQPGLSTSDVLASELFGHEKGAFTGAEDTREGLLLRAHGGTFFLDEIDGLPLETQTALLGVLQEKRFRRMGADTETAVDIRFITATNAEAEKLVDEGKMRSDFFHRIAHGRVYVPALRERLGDIPLLVENLSCRLEQEERIQSLEWSERAIEKLLAHQWPGNIRELEGVIEGASAHACFYGRHEVLPEDVTLHSINPRTQDAVQQSALSVEENPSPQETLHSQVALFKKNVVKRVLEENGGNQAQAARSLGIDRTTLRRILLA